MKVEVFGVAKWNDKYEHTTKGKEYAILKIRYTKLDTKGLVTFIDDNGNLNTLSSRMFTFKTKETK